LKYRISSGPNIPPRDIAWNRLAKVAAKRGESFLAAISDREKTLLGNSPMSSANMQNISFIISEHHRSRLLLVRKQSYREAVSGTGYAIVKGSRFSASIPWECDRPAAGDEVRIGWHGSAFRRPLDAAGRSSVNLVRILRVAIVRSHRQCWQRIGLPARP